MTGSALVPATPVINTPAAALAPPVPSLTWTLPEVLAPVAVGRVNS